MKSRFKDPVTNFMVKNPFIPSILLLSILYTSSFYELSTLLYLTIMLVVLLYYIICFISMKIPTKEEREQIIKDEKQKAAENKAGLWTLLSSYIFMGIGLIYFMLTEQKIAGMTLMCMFVFSIILFSILNAIFLHKNKKNADSKEKENDNEKQI